MRHPLVITYCLLVFVICISNLTQARYFTNKAHGFASTTNFECQTPGRFPDPYNCHYYYQCHTGGTHTRYKCGLRQKYSVQLQSCDRSFPLVCNGPAFRCTTVGDRGAWPGDASIFYICSAAGNGRKLKPVLFKCPDGTGFNGAECV